MTLPIIHLNGTSGETLRDDNLAVRSKIMDVLEAMRVQEFNRRDYCPVEGRWEMALAEREIIEKSLRLASDHFLGIAEHCQRIIDEKIVTEDQKECNRVIDALNMREAGRHKP